MQYKAEIFDQKYSSLLQKVLVESVKKPMLLEDALNIKGFLHSFAAEDPALRINEYSVLYWRTKIQKCQWTAVG